MLLKKQIQTTDPECFIPTPDPTSRKYRTWGLPATATIPYGITIFDSDTHAGIQTCLSRRLVAQKLYADNPTPEEQFIEVLGKRKERELLSRGKGDRHKRDYVLDVVLADVYDERGDVLCWRRVKVPGRMTLDSLKDMVLLPAMGWYVCSSGFIW
jgi:hypothetical protein